MTQKKAIIFDMDGTLVDTESLASGTIQEVFSGYGTPVSAEDAQFVIGRKWEFALDLLYEKYQPTDSRKHVNDETMLQYRKKMENALPQIPGAVEWVERFAEDYSLALVSGSNRRDILWILDRLGIRRHFSHTLGSEDYKESKPDPEGFNLALKKMGVTAQETLCFEDSKAGIDSGIAAGMTVIAVRTAHELGGVLTQNQEEAHGSIEDFREIDDAWIKKWLG